MTKITKPLYSKKVMQSTDIQTRLLKGFSYLFSDYIITTLISAWQ